MKNTGITFRKLIAIFVILCATYYNNVYATEVRITFIKHNGFIIRSDNLTFYVDVTIKPNDTLPLPDVIFITHSHSDHFVKSTVIDIANTSGAYVFGPQDVTASLTDSLPIAKLITYTPSTGTKMTGSILGVNLTMYGSYETNNQNSYRFEFPSGATVYQDGDMGEVAFEAFVLNGCSELLNMDIAMLGTGSYTISDFYSNYSPNVMIEMHLWSLPCVVYASYPASFYLTTENTYIYTYTAVNENPNPENEIKVFPNPSNNITNIQFSNPKNKNHTLTIYNTNGQIVSKIGNITNDVIKIENKNWKNGLYFFQLENNNRITKQGKFIIER